MRKLILLSMLLVLNACFDAGIEVTFDGAGVSASDISNGLTLHKLGTTQVAGSSDLVVNYSVTDDSGNTVSNASLNHQLTVTAIDGVPTSTPLTFTDWVQTSVLTSTDPTAMLANMDDSGSLGGTDPDDLRLDALNELVDSLRVTDQLALYRFSTNLTNNYELQHDFSSDKVSLKNAIAGNSSGMTPLWESSYKLYNTLNDDARFTTGFNKMMILFSDGQPTDDSEVNAVTSNTYQDDFLAQIDINSATSPKIPVFTVGFGSAFSQQCNFGFASGSQNVLQEIASKSGGSYVFVQSASDLTNVFAALGVASGSYVQKRIDFGTSGISAAASHCITLTVRINVSSSADPNFNAQTSTTVIFVGS